MDRKKGRKVLKKNYEKPLLRVVNIAPGVQTLGTGCKLAGSGLSINNPCASHVCSTFPGS
jgi:hypothetical protein